MPQLFPRWANAAVRAALLAFAALLGGVPIALLAFARTPAATGQFRTVAQPIAFSHPVHVNGLHIDCLYCHGNAERSAMAGLPPTRACVGCHRQIWLASNVFAPVRRSLRTGAPIAWQRITSVPDFVYFSHVAHTRKGVSCESCHGRVDLMQQVYQAAPLTMSWCVSCHRMPESSLRPLEAVTAMGWKPAGDPDSTGRALAREYHVRSLTTCTACHR